MRNSVALAALVLASAGCKDPSGSRTVSGRPLEVSSPAEVVLKIGQEARIDALLRLGFTGVPADSRCPATAECIWAGDGVVTIVYSVGMAPTFPDTLHTTIDPKSVQFVGYTITLLELTPYPQSFEPIPSDQYAARFRIERNPQARGPD
jgi:hypothetical protein